MTRRSIPRASRTPERRGERPLPKGFLRIMPVGGDRMTFGPDGKRVPDNGAIVPDDPWWWRHVQYGDFFLHTTDFPENSSQKGQAA